MSSSSSAASSTLRVISSVGHLGDLERERHVLPHGHVRVDGVALEHHRHVAVLGVDVVDDLAADLQLALGDVLEADDHVEQRRLPAARRAHEDEELAVADGEVGLLHRLEAVAVPLGELVEHDLGHVVSLLSP